MTRRKLKPGPKRPVGRPAKARKREADAIRLKNERKILSEIGIVSVTIWVDEIRSNDLREASKLKRIQGLLAHAEDVGDTEKAKELRAKLELAQIERDRGVAARAEQRAEDFRMAWEEKRRRAFEDRRRAEVDAAAQRLAESRQSTSVNMTGQAPPEGLSDAEIRSLVRKNKPYLI